MNLYNTGPACTLHCDFRDRKLLKKTIARLGAKDQIMAITDCGVEVTIPGLCFVKSGPCGWGKHGCVDDERGKWSDLPPGDHEGHCPPPDEACGVCQDKNKQCHEGGYEARRVCDLAFCRDCRNDEFAQECGECVDKRCTKDKFDWDGCRGSCGLPCFDPAKDCELCLRTNTDPATSECDGVCKDTKSICSRCMNLTRKNCSEKYSKDEDKLLCAKAGYCAPYCSTPQDMGSASEIHSCKLENEKGGCSEIFVMRYRVLYIRCCEITYFGLELNKASCLSPSLAGPMTSRIT
ncbi:hypothetical protein VHEMI10256 [[Torrubiella] hemipterigena]|uniref:Uncharacterized protein n=1 Tax=[Torrubiella] hemipterigena TaxID=1531966 RepID=A0A0A1TRK8_9HYPO|nr:hypothetical protein VHEMI10256 [[Torrubiella] hemipterigena]